MGLCVVRLKGENLPEQVRQILRSDGDSAVAQQGHRLVPRYLLWLALALVLLSLPLIWGGSLFHRAAVLGEVQRKSQVIGDLLSIKILDANATEDWEEVSRVLDQAASLDEVELALVVGPSGRVIESRDLSHSGRKFADVSNEDLRRSVEKVMESGMSFALEWRAGGGGAQWVQLLPLSSGATGSDSRSVFVLGLGLSRVESGMGWSLMFLIGLALLSVGGTLLISSRLLSRFVAEPVDVLTQAVGDTGQGVEFRVRGDLRFEEYRHLGASLEYAFGRTRDARDLAKVERERFASVVTTLPGAFYQCYWGTGGRDFMVLSQNIHDLVGFTEGQLIGNDCERDYADLIHEDDRERVHEELRRSVARRESFEIVYRMQNVAGEEIWVSDHGCGVIDADGRLLHMDGVVFDITERMRHKIELEAARDELQDSNAELSSAFEALEISTVRANELAALAQEASASKSEFLANMSHEIRTPMTAILGYADMILEGDQSDSGRRECGEIIKRNGEHLLSLINDILDVSKIDADKMTVEQIECSPWTVARDVRDLMTVRAKDKKLKLELVADGPLPKVMRSDPTRIRQILTNLIGNSIKFTESGSVTLRVSARGTPAEGDCALCYEVLDTGIGLSKTQIAGLFGAFTQADTSTTRKFGGTGLGLHIAERLAGLLGGGIEVESVPDKGSCFRVLIDPHLDADAEFGDVEILSDGGGEPVKKTEAVIKKLDARVLLAEDGPDNQRLISFLLRKAGATVDLAENGVVAYEKAVEANEDGSGFDVILMDMQMPELDGYGATKKLRKTGYEGPIIALTAHAMTGDRERCIDAGCDDYTTKPVKRQELFEKISRLCTDSGLADPGSTDSGSSDPGSSDPGSSDPGSTDPESL